MTENRTVVDAMKAELQRQFDESGANGLGYLDMDDERAANIDGFVDLVLLAAAVREPELVSIRTLSDPPVDARPLLGGEITPQEWLRQCADWSRTKQANARAREAEDIADYIDKLEAAVVTA